MRSVTRTVWDTVCRENLFAPNDTVYVALSGGADSVTLLHVLCDLKERLSLKSIRALHVNHGLRDEYADRDETFVRELCAQLQIPLTVEHADIRAVARETHKSVEEAARDVRYAFFKRETDGEKSAKIATAHTADDRAETVVLHLLRGCGLRGLNGIPYQRETIVRPLLDCSSQEVREFAKANGYSYVYDETNADEQYTRNFIRHRIFPLFKEVNPSAVTAILRLSDLVSEDEDYLQNEAHNILKLATIRNNEYTCIPIVHAAKPVATRALIAMFSKASNVRPEQRHVDELFEIIKQGGSAALPNNFIARSDGKILRFFKADRTKETNIAPPSVLLSTEQDLLFLNKRYTPHILTQQEFLQNQKIHKNLLDFSIDYDMISGSVYLRTRKGGDSFRPYKRNCTKTLKKFFQEQNIPAKQRNRVPILCDDRGILAVIGYGIDERAAVTERTNHILYIETSPERSE